MVLRLFYAAQCPNCSRFVGAMERTPVASQVQRIDVDTLTPEQRRHVHAVPMVVLDDGTSLVGSKAFEWLKQHEERVELDSFSASSGLGFSAIDDTNTFVTYSQNFSAFERV